MCSLIRPCTWATTCALAVVTICLTSASGADGVPGGSDSLVGGLAVLSDLQAIAATDAPVLFPLMSDVPATKQAMARQSVPTRDRAMFYRGTAVFSLSKVAMPLLVADLEQREVSETRPMSGHSVGARPSAAWTRTIPILPESVVPARTASVFR